MKFSEHFGVTRSAVDDWFDSVLTVDTKLFIDPFLIYDEEADEFIGSHSAIIELFNAAYTLVAQSGGNRQSVSWQRAVGLLTFPEVSELCLGYASDSTSGAGSGAGFGRTMAEAILEAIAAGLEEIKHFEEVGILRLGVGADRISDIAANILRSQLADYTTRICLQHGVPLREWRHPKGRYDLAAQRWTPLTFTAPVNPATRQAILLVPSRYLRDLPSISAESFWDYCAHNENAILRAHFGADITGRVAKESIVAVARAHPEARERFLAAIEEEGGRPYDQGRDPKGLVGWYDASRDYVQAHGINLRFHTADEFKAFVEELLREFRNYVENNGGWSLLWNDNGVPKSEEAFQRLFLGIVKHYCKANNIDLSPEVNVGRGPVDFKMAQGYQFRALLEAKLAHNSKFWHGLSKQLPKYQEGEDVNIGFFVVLIQTDKDAKLRLPDLQKRVEEVRDATKYDINAFVIDGRLAPLSASKL